jgi:hypothetical protein
MALSRGPQTSRAAGSEGARLAPAASCPRAAVMVGKCCGKSCWTACAEGVHCSTFQLHCLPALLALLSVFGKATLLPAKPCSKGRHSGHVRESH